MMTSLLFALLVLAVEVAHYGDKILAQLSTLQESLVNLQDTLQDGTTYAPRAVTTTRLPL